MTTPGAEPSTGRLAAALTARRLALGWAAVTLAVAAATAPAQGISRDESIYLVAAESYAAFWIEGLRATGDRVATVDRYFAVNHEHPPFAKEVFGLTHAALANGLGWTSHLQGFRTGAFLFAALLSALLAAAGFELCGAAGALLAPALFWAVPRHFYHAHPAVLDLPVTALWLATVLAYARSLSPDPRRARRSAVLCGLLFGAAISTKHNAWLLPPLLGAHWFATRLGALRRERWRAAVPFPAAFPAMAILGPAVFVAAWPWLWHDGLSRFREYVTFHLHHENYPWHYLGRLLREPPFPVEYPFVVTALTVPAASLFAMAAGLAHAVVRLFRRGLDGLARSREGLLVVNALFPLAVIAWPTVPHFGGVKHWLPAMPFLALLGARTLVWAGATLWPAQRWAVTGALSLAALAPAVLEVAHVHPYGTAAYNELAGGAAGAATLGMQRQFWGDAAVGVLEAVNAHAAPGARVWWQETTYLAVRAWQRDGRLRGDLRWAEGPEGADLSIWQYHQEFREKEYRTWTELAEPARPGDTALHARPVTGVYLDEVPLVQVYARHGAWR